MRAYEILPLGEDALILRVKDAQYDEAVPLIHHLMAALSRALIFDEIVPAYDSIMVQFDPQKHSPAAVQQRLAQSYEMAASAQEASFKTGSKASPAPSPKIVPICYGAEFGPDLTQSAHILGLSEEELISHHTAKPFLVSMLGFLPGFTYLSATPKALHIARHDRPRLSVPAGSVGLAGWQTGIYALPSPGGWRIIGQTPLSLFTPKAQTPFQSPFHFTSGEWIQFKAISADEFRALTTS